MNMREIIAMHNRVRTVGEALAAVNLALKIAQPYTTQSNLPFPIAFTSAYSAVVQHKQDLERRNSAEPIDFAFGTPIRKDVERLYIELGGIEGFRERLQSISLVDELGASARNLVSEIPSVAGTIGNTAASLLTPLVPMILLVVFVIVVARKKS